MLAAAAAGMIGFTGFTLVMPFLPLTNVTVMEILAISAFTLALITGMSVPDTSENATANLAWTDIKLPKPVFEGDTLWAESEIIDKRESKSTPSVGIISMRCRGINQRREVVIEFKRTIMVYKREHSPRKNIFPVAK